MEAELTFNQTRFRVYLAKVHLGRLLRHMISVFGPDVLSRSFGPCRNTVMRHGLNYEFFERCQPTTKIIATNAYISGIALTFGTTYALSPIYLARVYSTF